MPGRLGFNSGSVQQIATAGGAETASRVVAVTILGGATGGVTTTALSLWLGEKVRDAPVTPPVTHP